MPSLSATVSVELDAAAFGAAVGRIASGVAAGASDPQLQAGLRASGRVYMAAMRSRFASASNGDGTWQDLAPSTKAKRLHTTPAKAAGARVPILNDTGRLYRSLTSGAAGNLDGPTSDGYRVGTADPRAAFHQFGTKTAPVRAILIAPDAALLAAMTRPVVDGLRALIDRALAA